MKRLFIFFLLCYTLSIYAQDTLTISFKPEYHEIDQKGFGIMKVLEYESDTVRYKGKKYKITLPSDFFVSDTAFAFNYFTGWKNAKIPKATAFLLGDYKSRNPVLFVDYNHNLDFSDDGQPLKFDQDTSVVVYLRNSEYSSTYFPIKFFYPKISEKGRQQVEPVYRTSGPDRANKAAAFEYWLADRRLNYKVTTTWVKGVPIRLGLFDWDCNGLFDDKDVDRILVGDYEANAISGNLQEGARLYKDGAQIVIGQDVYEVVEIEKRGQYLKMVASDQPAEDIVSVGDMLPNFSVQVVGDTLKSINELREVGKYLLLDFWGSWCRGCIQQLPELQSLHEQFKDKLQIIGLNYGDTDSKAKASIEKHNVKWINGFATKSIIKQLRIDGFPNNILIDPDGKILAFRVRLAEVEAKF